MSILKKFSCDIDKFTLIYGLFPSDAFVLNSKSGIITNQMTLSAFDIYKREVFDVFKVLEIVVFSFLCYVLFFALNNFFCNFFLSVAWRVAA